jgi:protein phosphatase PTC2/3
MKLPEGSPSPLIAKPEICWMIPMEDDEFLIIGYDGIFVMTSQNVMSSPQGTPEA